MPQVISCPHCQTRLQVPDGAAGKQVRCSNPKCQKVLVVGGAAPARQPVAAAAGARPSAPPSRSVQATPPPPKPAAAAAPTECPACKAKLLPGAIACMDCGYLLQSDSSTAEMEGPPNICPNPACGVANPPGERNCQRCTTPLRYPPGTVLYNRFRIERHLADGGFGQVYLGTDTKNGNRAVALKEMICGDPQEFGIRLKFFQREAGILRSLQTLSTVPRVFDLIEQGQTALLALEFIKGQDLLKIMEANNNKPFNLDQVIEWGKNVCDVLGHMHNMSPPLVHRDLKPDNIMLLEDQRTIKMIDFGTARDLGRTQKEKQAAKTKVYTEGYAPPEQIIGKPEARSDLFALAGTLYHLATGKPPEGIYTAREIEEQLKDGNGALPAQQRWFYELVKINLSEDINDRYFSAREFRADLERKRVTKEVACPKCKQTNKVREPYCAKCAEPLTDKMPSCQQCGKENRMGSRCCIHCGNRLR